jgi:hypothetical protein
MGAKRLNARTDERLANTHSITFLGLLEIVWPAGVHDHPSFDTVACALSEQPIRPLQIQSAILLALASM